jgi:hypothetical protein
MFEKAACVGDDSKARQLRKLSWLYKTQHPTTRSSKEMVINLSGRTLDDGTYSLIQKGLNCAVTARTTPIEDILAGVEKAVHSLPVEMAEEARQETKRNYTKLLQTQRQLNKNQEGSTAELKEKH